MMITKEKRGVREKEKRNIQISINRKITARVISNKNTYYMKLSEEHKYYDPGGISRSEIDGHNSQ